MTLQEMYQPIEIFYTNDHQKIEMASKQDDPNAIVLINTLHPNDVIDLPLFNRLVNTLNNIVYHEVQGEEMTLVTSYGNGMPLKSYITHFNRSDQEKTALLDQFMSEIRNYDQLPPAIIRQIIDPDHVLVREGVISFNEIIKILPEDEDQGFHDLLATTVAMVLHDASEDMAGPINAYFESQDYAETKRLDDVYKAYRTLRSKAKPVPIIPRSPGASASAGRQVTKKPIKPSQTLLVWLLMIIPVLAFAFWGFTRLNVKEPSPHVSFEAIPTAVGWTFNNTTDEDALPIGTTYKWEIFKNGTSIETANTKHFSFSPDEPGDYVVTLTVMAADGSELAKYQVNASKSEDGQTALTPPVDPSEGGENPPGETENQDGSDPSIAGQITRDTKVYQSPSESLRITHPTGAFYPVTVIKGQPIQSGDIFSMWVKSSDYKAIQYKLVGYVKGKAVYEYQGTIHPKLHVFELVTLMIKTPSMDELHLWIMSDNQSVWFDDITIEMIK